MKFEWIQIWGGTNPGMEFGAGTWIYNEIDGNKIVFFIEETGETITRVLKEGDTIIFKGVIE